VGVRGNLIEAGPIGPIAAHGLALLDFFIAGAAVWRGGVPLHPCGAAVELLCGSLGFAISLFIQIDDAATETQEGE